MDMAPEDASEPRGLVRISAPKAFSPHVLHPHQLSFLHRHPDVDVQLAIVYDRDVDPIREGVDLVVRLTQDPPQGLAARPFMDVQTILCATPAYLARGEAIRHPHDLVSHSCLSLGEHERDNHWRFHRGDEDAEVVVHGRYVANHSEIRLEGVLEGLGIGCLPDFMARQALDEGTVVRVLPEWTFQSSYQGQACVLYPPNRFMVPKCRVLIDHLAEALVFYSSSSAPSRREAGPWMRTTCVDRGSTRWPRSASPARRSPTRCSPSWSRAIARRIAATTRCSTLPNACRCSNITTLKPSARARWRSPVPHDAIYDVRAATMSTRAPIGRATR